MAAARPATWRRYAFALVVWLEFLRAFGRRWEEATARDVEAFKEWRLGDLRNEGRVQPTTFDTDRAALNTFYDWAGPRYGLANPVATIKSRRARGPGPADEAHSWSGVARDPLRPAGASRRQVKWMLRGAFEQWRDIGLCGYGFDGVRRPGWRGANEDRDAAFVDGLYGTGLRLSEWASVLDVELPSGAGDRRWPKAWLSAACIKGGGRGREYRVPRRVLSSVAAYLDPVEGSRIEAVRRAQRAGRYERLPGLRVVTDQSSRARALLVESAGGSATMSLDVLGVDERRRLFRRTPTGLEPLWLWLAPDGLAKKPYGWEDTFSAANRRIARAWVNAGDGADSQRPARQEAQSPLWARPHMLRHSFCLKWFSILSAVWRQRVAGLTVEETLDLRDQLGDLWYQLATLMGHSHPMTTRAIYLEPFTGLEIDYLMELLDEDETAGVDALLRTLAHEGGRTLSAVSAEPDPSTTSAHSRRDTW
jgi:integrase